VNSTDFRQNRKPEADGVVHFRRIRIFFKREGEIGEFGRGSIHPFVREEEVDEDGAVALVFEPQSGGAEALECQAVHRRSGDNVTEDGHVDCSIIVGQLGLNIAEESVDDVEEEVVLLESIKAADVPRIYFKGSAERFADDGLEGELKHATSGGEGQRGHGAGDDLTDVGFGEVVGICQDRSVEFVTDLVIRPGI